MGVTSSIRPMRMPARARARRADWAPGPGVLVPLPPVARILTWRAVIPSSSQVSFCSSLSIPGCLTLAASSNILGCQHGGVGRALVTVGLDLHALLYWLVHVACSPDVCTYTSDTGDGFAARKIGDVDEGVVEGSEDTGNTEDKLTLRGCQFIVSRLPMLVIHEPRGPGVRVGCSPGERGRPSAWEACWRI